MVGRFIQNGVSGCALGMAAWLVPLPLNAVPAADAVAAEVERLVCSTQRWCGDLDVLRRKRMLRVMVCYSKTFYFLDGAQQRGLTYDLLREFETFVNQRLRTGVLRVEVVVVPVRRDELLSTVVEGRGDIAAANLTITPERRGMVAFTEPLASGINELVVTTRPHPALARAEELSGQPVYVRRSSSYFESLTALNARLRAAKRAPVKIQLVNENLEDEDILEMVNAGLIPATIVDSHLAQFWARVLPQLMVHTNVAVRHNGQIAWALRPHSPHLQALLNDFVRTHKQGTLLGNVIIQRYLRSITYVTNAVASAELKKFDATIGMFRRYGAHYGFDALMLAALGYQESMLDQRARSHHGAIGVMQLLPATAADPKIKIARIDQVDNNIHAGTKYLRWLHDTYFKDATMDALNRTLFTFASYNAGPGRIAGLRAQAAAEGLNSNVWFHHVEVVAARVIGRETVRYVSNIYKYYLAYTLMAQRQQERATLLRGAIK